jgi:hypothetical protein
LWAADVLVGPFLRQPRKWVRFVANKGGSEDGPTLQRTNQELIDKVDNNGYIDKVPHLHTMKEFRKATKPNQPANALDTSTINVFARRENV